MKNVAVLMEAGAFALFFFPHPRGLDSSRVSSPREFATQGKKNAYVRGQHGDEGQAQLELTDALYEDFHVPGKSRLG